MKLDENTRRQHRKEDELYRQAYEYGHAHSYQHPRHHPHGNMRYGLRLRNGVQQLVPIPRPDGLPCIPQRCKNPYCPHCSKPCGCAWPLSPYYRHHRNRPCQRTPPGFLSSDMDFSTAEDARDLRYLEGFDPYEQGIFNTRYRPRRSYERLRPRRGIHHHQMSSDSDDDESQDYHGHADHQHYAHQGHRDDDFDPFPDDLHHHNRHHAANTLNPFHDHNDHHDLFDHEDRHGRFGGRQPRDMVPRDPFRRRMIDGHPRVEELHDDDGYTEESW